MRFFGKNPKVKVMGISVSSPSNEELKKEAADYYARHKDEIAAKRKTAKESPKPKVSRGEETRSVTEKSLDEFRSLGIKRYKISTCGDERVCPNCKRHDGKDYNVKDAQTGKNAPPFCDECRCIILPVLPF